MRCSSPAAATYPITNVDREQHLRDMAEEMTLEQAADALQATRQTLDLLERTNTNARLALEVMFLDYPGLPRAM